jgi:putative ABC transport system permease protein
MIRNYIKTAFRNLWRNKAFSVINIVGLSVALACCMLILLYTMDEVSYDRFNANRDKIYRLVSTSTNPQGVANKMASTGVIHGPSFKRQIPEIEDFVRIQSDNYTVKRGNEVFNQDALYADDNFFSVFSFPLVRGNAQTALRDIHSVVLSEDVAEKYFGKQNAIGQVLQLKVNEVFQPFVVSAVIKRSPQNSSIKIQMLLPFKNSSSYTDDQWFNFYLNTFFTIKPGADIKNVEGKIAKIFSQDASDQMEMMADKYGFKDKIRFSLQPFLQIHTSKDYPADNGLTDASDPVYSYILTGIALFILLIACINFVNLTVARSLKRAKEIGIRKVVGGQRKQLIAQFLGESFILSLIAFLLGLILVQLALPVFNDLANKALSFSYLLSTKLVMGYIAIFLLTGLLAGFYPALVLSGFNPVESLYNRQHFAGKNYLSKGLVVLQFTLATFFIIATITIYSQFDYLMHFNLGYNDKNVVSIKTDNPDKQKMALFKTELLKNPSIKSVTADQGGRWGTIAHINNGQQTSFDIKHIDEDYLPLFEIPVVQGRNFSKDMVSDSSNSVLVNETFVKQAGWKNPIGQVVDFFYNNHKKYNVIGVVKDYHFLSLTEKISPQFFSMKPSYPFGNIFIKIQGNNTAEPLNYIQKLFKQIFPFKPYQYAFKAAQNAEQYDKEAKWKQIVTFSAVLTIFISCIGLFGLATLSAERRKKEIGIRKVLGASVEVIVTRLSTDFLKLVMLSAVIASPAAWWAMHKWLENYPYRIAINTWIFLFAALLVVLVALVTVSFHAIKAAIANPVDSLRSE